MSGRKLIRWAGLAGLVSGVLIVITDVLFWAAVGGQPTSAVGASSAWIATVTLTLLAVYLGFLALIGLYARQATESGGLGLTSFVVASLGTSLNIGFLWAGLFVVPDLIEVAPDYLDAVDVAPSGMVAVGFISAVLLFSLGWALVGIASLRAGVLPSLPSWLLLLGAILGFVSGIVDLPFGAVVLGVALAWLGWWLWSEKETAPI